MLVYRGPPSRRAMPGDALNTNYLHLAIRCLGCVWAATRIKHVPRHAKKLASRFGRHH